MNVLFKGTQDGIIIVISDNIPFSDIEKELRDKLGKSKEFFAGVNTNIRIKCNTLSKSEEKEVFSIIENVANLDINFIGNDYYFSNKVLTTPALKIVKQEPIKNITSNDIFNTLFHKGTLRSGDKLNHHGSIVVLGDTNPGSEIVANGNIIVLGKLGGLAHAGRNGYRDAYIFAYNLSAIQLRIDTIITFLSDSIIKENKSKPIPRYAYIDGDKIYIAKRK